jgi:hypothetical protein
MTEDAPIRKSRDARGSSGSGGGRRYQPDVLAALQHCRRKAARHLGASDRLEPALYAISHEQLRADVAGWEARNAS